MMKLVRPGLLYLTTCLRLRGMLAGLSLLPSLPAPPVPTNINIITIRGTHAAAYTSLHLTGTTMFSLNMRGLCHASVDTVYRRDSVLCHCHPSDNWPECQLLFIRVHQSLYVTITQSHNDIQHYFQFFSIGIYYKFWLSFFRLDSLTVSKYFPSSITSWILMFDVVWCEVALCQLEKVK